MNIDININIKYHPQDLDIDDKPKYSKKNIYKKPGRSQTGLI